MICGIETLIRTTFSFLSRVRIQLYFLCTGDLLSWEQLLNICFLIRLEALRGPEDSYSTASEGDSHRAGPENSLHHISTSIKYLLSTYVPGVGMF